MVSNNKLSTEDIAHLLNDPSTESREDAATKIAQQFTKTSLSDSERRIAEDIFRLMAQDAEVRVRKALSINLQASSDIPKDIALMFARDVGDVAIPVLEHSDVFTDEDLIAIINSSGVDKQTAIAGRDGITEELSDALVETKNVQVVAALASNESAEISEQSLNKAVEYTGDSETVQRALIDRSALPITVIEKLVTNISEVLGQELAKKHALPDHITTDLAEQSRERATILLAGEAKRSEVAILVDSLHKNGRLTPSIILRAICSGDITFFEMSLAKRSNVTLQNVVELVHDKGGDGLNRLLERAKFPEQQFIAVHSAIRAMEDLADSDEQGPEQVSRRVMELVLTSYDDLGVELENEDLQYLMKKLNEISFIPDS